MLKSTRKYVYFLVLLTCIEVIFAVPLLVDYIVTKEQLQSLLFVTPALHALGYVYVSLGYTEIKSRLFHPLGILTIATNMMFPFSFLFHLILAIMGIMMLKRVYRAEKLKLKKKEQEELIKNSYEIRKKLSDFDDEEIPMIDIEEAEDYF